MDVLVHMVDHIPEWIKRLDDLNGQIEQRQMELATLDGDVPNSSGGSGGSGGSRKSGTSVKKQGSTELRQPGYEPPARAPNTLRKRPRPDSAISGQGAPRHRNRSMMLVYYDSYVQTFFEDLVKFVSASRNQIRKAKMAAKVAQIRRLAEPSTPDAERGEDGDADKENVELVHNGLARSTAALAADTSLPLEAGPIRNRADDKDNDNDDKAPIVMQYRSTRGAKSPRVGGGPISLPGVAKWPGVYDALDSGLEDVQNMCERAAHQFLRDGDCAEDVAGMERRLAETGEVAARELDRLRREEPQALRVAEEEAGRGRVHRPLRMTALVKEGGAWVHERELPATVVGSGKLEVDEAVDDLHDDVPLPPIMYRSTRRVC